MRPGERKAIVYQGTMEELRAELEKPTRQDKLMLAFIVVMLSAMAFFFISALVLFFELLFSN